jgi:putative ABC transport system permease protein
MSEADIKYPPSKFGHWLLNHIIHGEVRDSALGDFEEEYLHRLYRQGIGTARLWYWAQIVRSLPAFLIDRLWWAAVMSKSYLIVSWRDLRRNKAFAGINMLGLSTGLACGIIVLLFVQNELSFDTYNVNAKNIYRLVRKEITPAGEEYLAITPWTMRDTLLQNFPEVRNSVRIYDAGMSLIEYGEKYLSSSIMYADPSLLDIFTLPLVRGDSATALTDPSAALFSEDIANKIFGKENPLGKTITAFFENKKYSFRVSGVLKNIPQNSHFQIGILVPIHNLPRRYANSPNRLNFVTTYVLLNSKANPKEFQQNLEAFLKRSGTLDSSSISYFIQPLTSIYLQSEKILSGTATGRPAVLYGLSALAFFILLIVSFNFMSLSISKASRRLKQLGLRRTLGATRSQLFSQLLGESLFLAFLSLLPALLLARILLPVFNSLIGRAIPPTATNSLVMLLSILILTLLVGILSGAYPALVLSSFKPVELLRGGMDKGRQSGIYFKRGLVFFQYCLSIIFIIATIIVIRQNNFIQKKDLGFRKDNIIVIFIGRDPVLPRIPEAIKDSLKRNPSIEKVAVTSGPPGFESGYPVQCLVEGNAKEHYFNLNVLPVGEDFFNFFGIEILKGRSFSSDSSSDANSAAIINQSAARYLGWDDPIGKPIWSEQIEKRLKRKGPFTVIGVVKDIHNGPLQERIKPSIYVYVPEDRSDICLQLRPGHIPETMAFVDKALRDLHAVMPFEYSFLDDDLINVFYKGIPSIRRIFVFSSALALLLYGLGVFGLTSYEVDRRMKEIGIRIVMGASLINIIRILLHKFTKFVMLSSLIAGPIAFWIGQLLFRSFAYRTGMVWWPFIVAPAGVYIITFTTIGIQAAQACSVNPADTLRHE